ncbi:hypothetical protein HZS_2149 [Henneguya salminicola]|nr:hypothetical protein HZS_2149 [Henneguya salminicola]
MSLTPYELKLIEKIGTEEEKKYASKIYPIREKGNIILTAIIILNTSLNTASTVMINNITNSFTAIAISAIMIVVFAEIIPQSICSRYALKIVAKTIYILWFVLIITLPLSYPLGMLLNSILDNKEPTMFNKERLKEIVRVNCDNTIDQQEKNIIFSGLNFNNKTVKDVMVPLKDCYLVDKNDILNKEKLKELTQERFRRIPVFNKRRENIVGVMDLTDVIFINPQDNIPVKNVLNVNKRKVMTISREAKLGTALKSLKNEISHLAIVREGSTTGERENKALKCFNEKKISLDVVNKLVNRRGNILLYEDKLSGTSIYKKGFPANYFILIIEGNVQIYAGNESLSFSQGPYHYFGYPCLESVISFSQSQLLIPQRVIFVPDFSLTTKGKVLLLKIRAKQLLAILDPNWNNKLIREHSSCTIGRVSSNSSIYVSNSSNSCQKYTAKRILIITNKNYNDQNSFD